MKRLSRISLAVGVFALLAGARPPQMDGDNPTCPAEPDWGPAEPMALETQDIDGRRVLIASGIIDNGFPDRLYAALSEDELIEEIWLKSRGGSARAGNEAGRIIRNIPGMYTRIPTGWTCFSACNFVFMGGRLRQVEPGGVFMVHMFTHTGNRGAIEDTLEEGTEATAELIAEIEQSSALLATDDNDFLIRMGVSRELLSNIMYRVQAVATDQNPETRYCLDDEEVLYYNVANVSDAK